ncbi:MAG: TlpA family protein disulfide reductase, partial [Pyrinomonadaceae bacterium]
SSSKRALLFFSTTCPFCHKQFPYWQQLLSNADQGQYRLTALTTETDTQAIRKYLHSMNCDRLEVLTIAPEVAARYKLNVTPITLVIGNNGLVEKTWSGMWREDSLTSASSYFAVNFTAQ